MKKGYRANGMMPKRRSLKAFKPKKVIAVDVDGTLMVKSKPNQPLIEWCRKKREEGFTLMLWSARGEAHAKRAAEWTDTVELFDHIISKPGCIVDDVGWSWIRYVKTLSPFNFAEGTSEAEEPSDPEGEA